MADPGDDFAAAAWPTGCSYDASSDEPFNQLRMELGDTDAQWVILSDAELKAILRRSGGIMDDALLRALVIIIAKLGSYTDESVGSVRISLSQRLKAYQDLYTLMRSRQGIDFGLAGGLPYAGGISRTDNAEMDSDTDRAPMYFGRRKTGPLPRETLPRSDREYFGAGTGSLRSDPEED